MARWGFWDWMAYCCLGIAAVGLAAGAALKEGPVIFDRLPAFFTNPRWAYVPIILFALGSAILAIRAVAPLLFGGTSFSSSERIFIDDTPETILKLTDGLTTVQRNKFAEIYIGKWMKVTGPVRNVMPSRKDEKIVTVSFGLAKSVSLRFDRQWSDRVAMLRVKQTISAIGKVKEISVLDIDLVECELISVSQTSSPPTTEVERPKP